MKFQDFERTFIEKTKVEVGRKTSRRPSKDKEDEDWFARIVLSFKLILEDRDLERTSQLVWRLCEPRKTK